MTTEEKISELNKSIRIIKDQVMNIEHENLCALVDHKLITDCCKSIMIETDKLESNINYNVKIKKRYVYKGKQYCIFQKTKMKIDGKWIDCVIYQTLYNNIDGKFWVRSSKEFYDLFVEA